MSAPAPAQAEPPSSIANFPRAMLNILGDLTDEKSRLRDTQKAVLNILEDFTNRRDAAGLTQRAMLNILDDFDEVAKRRAAAEAEARRANSDLGLRMAQLETANADLEAFSYSVSHDLRAPLRAVDGFSRILLEDYAAQLDAEGQRLLNVVRDSTMKLSQLIDDILAFSRAGRFDMRSVSVDMAQLVAGLLANELVPAVAGREVAINLGDLPEVQGDPAMLQRVWMNLLDNAIKFTAAKPDARIEVGARAGPGETTYYVRDNGVGFDMRYADKLFGVFQRLHGAEVPGTGIGLAILKRIIARHQGRVWAEGKVGEGATFYFTLPTMGEVLA